jgi:hypothetical protein
LVLSDEAESSVKPNNKKGINKILVGMLHDYKKLHLRDHKKFLVALFLHDVYFGE